MKNNLQKIGTLLIALVLLNVIGNYFYKRFDLTQDKRYTLSNASKIILSKANDAVHIKVYLKGDFPAEFKRLQTETKLHLEELKSLNSTIQYKFINPEKIGQSLIDKGLEPSSLQIEENGVFSELVIFPYAEVSYKNKIEYVSLLKYIQAKSQEEQLESSIQNLEFAFSNAIHKLTSEKKKKIAVLRGNGELNDIYLADFLRKLGEYYYLAPFTLDSVTKNPVKTLNQLSDFDLAIIAKPTQKFTEEEKYTLDQFIMKGKKTLWMIDAVQAELDSLMETGETLAYPRDLGLTDMFFNYGIRINPNLVTDLYCSQITLATGKIGNQTQFNQFFWQYYPLVNSVNNHPINTNIEAVRIKFCSGIDTLKNSISKTILLQSSPYAKTVGTPSIISLKSITENPVKETYNISNIPVAVLLKGSFKSGYAGRVKPFASNNPLESSQETEMVIISDGDIIANEISKGQPMELGIDKWTYQRFGNKEFLVNAVSYLLEDSSLLELRSKTVKINFLDKQKAFKESAKWQTINIILPLSLLAFFGLTFTYFRKKKYQ